MKFFKNRFSVRNIGLRIASGRIDSRVSIFSLLVLTSLLSCVSEQQLSEAQNTRYVEALPPQEKLVVAIMPVTNQSGIADLDVLSGALNETITANLNAMQDYEILTQEAGASRRAADYLLSGVIQRDKEDQLKAIITVETAKKGSHSTLEEPVASVLEVFTAADNLSGEVTQFFIDEIVLVGIVEIADEEKRSGTNRIIVDGKEVGMGLSELTLMAGERRIEIQNDDVLLYRSSVSVGDNTREVIDLRVEHPTELRLKLIESFPIPGAGISPHGITWDGESYWVVDEESYEVLELSPQGELRRRLEGPPGLLSGITFDGEYLWIGTFDSNGDASGGERGLYQIDRRDGREVSFLRCFSGDLTGLAWDGEAFWFGDFDEGGLIHQAGPKGRMQRSFSSPEADPLGLVYIDEFQMLCNVGMQSSKLFLVDLNGRVLDSVMLPTQDPIGLTWDGEAIVIAERERNRILRMEPSITVR